MKLCGNFLRAAGYAEDEGDGGENMEHQAQAPGVRQLKDLFVSGAYPASDRDVYRSTWGW